VTLARLHGIGASLKLHEVPNAGGPAAGSPAAQVFILDETEPGALSPEHAALLRAVVTRINDERAESTRRATLRAVP
jgi:hypothetical protein